MQTNTAVSHDRYAPTAAVIRMLAMVAGKYAHKKPRVIPKARVAVNSQLSEFTSALNSRRHDLAG
jgi:hypothetical protein